MSTLVERVYCATGIRLSLAEADQLERYVAITSFDFEAAMMKVLQDTNRVDVADLAERLNRLAADAGTTFGDYTPAPPEPSDP